MPQDPVSKIAVAKEKKEIADNAFKNGDLQTALLNYHEAMMYLHGLDKNMLSAMAGSPSSSRSIPASEPAAEEGAESISTPGIQTAKEDEKSAVLNEVDDLLGKIYSNQSACHMKKGNWKRAVETAEKALAKNPSNHKAQFRKGKAQAEIGYVEKALATLEDLLAKDESDKASINAEIARIKAADREREKKHNQKFKGFLNKKPAAINPYDSTPTGSSTTSVHSTDTAASTVSNVSSAGTVPAAATVGKAGTTGLSPQMTKAKLDEEAPKPLEPSGLMEVSEEEFERAKKARG